VSLSDLERDQQQASLTRDDPKFAGARIAAFQYLTVAVFIFLVAGFWDLQVRNPEFYSERAEENYIKSVPVLAPRGRIYDRDGRVIVDNHSSYSLILTRENLNPSHLRPIADGLGLDYHELVERLARMRTRPKYEPIIIKEELSPEDLAFVDAHRDRDTFPEMSLIRAQRRLYPENGVGAHVIGYVGEISELQLDNPEYADKYHPGDVIGQAGLEAQYNDSLMGTDGQRRVKVDNMGRERELMEDKPAVPGQDLHTTLDLDLQTVAELAMDGRQGAVVAMDPRNGEVLAMVSHPSFDPNIFSGRVPAKQWKELLSDPAHPMLNRAIQAQFAPGSTFKPIMALGGLEEGVITDDFKIHCPGGASFYGHYFACHKKGGHGTVELHKGIVQSCDVYFYNVGNHLGIDRIAKYAEMAGFGHRTGIDLPHEAEGVVPSTKWKWRNFRQKWFAGETISVAIGQGALTVTPIQLATAISGIADGGVWPHPHLVHDGKVGPARKYDVNLENVAKVIYGMYGVVNEGGTGGRARIPGLEVCGKTGTAQLASTALVKSANGKMKNNAWFVGFAPRENPEIVVVALFEHGAEGMMAAPIVRDVMKAYFDKKTRNEAPLPALAELEMPRLLKPPAPEHP
jgi:penicillin-binding protein 2